MTTKKKIQRMTHGERRERRAEILAMLKAAKLSDMQIALKFGVSASHVAAIRITAGIMPDRYRLKKI